MEVFYAKIVCVHASAGVGAQGTRCPLVKRDIGLVLTSQWRFGKEARRHRLGLLLVFCGS